MHVYCTALAHGTKAHVLTAAVCGALCSLQVSRKALLPKVLSVQGAELALRAPFKSPHPNAPARSEVRASRFTTPYSPLLPHPFKYQPFQADKPASRRRCSGSS